MDNRLSDVSWTRHFVYRAERTRTTWKFRIGLTLVVLGAAWITRGWWTVAIANSLVCEANAAPSDAVIIENFDPSYLPFERAARLRRDGVASRVLVPIATSDGELEPNEVEIGIAETLARLARVGSFEIVPIHSIEPFSLNAALDLLHFAEKEGIRSVIVVAPLFRSKRSALVYGAALGRGGIAVRCEPVHGNRTAKTWTNSWHGVQEVAEQWIKLQYYRFYMLPFRA